VRRDLARTPLPGPRDALSSVLDRIVSGTPVFCATCAAFHEGKIALVDGWPSVTWVGRPHDPDAVALRDHLAAIAEDGGKALALVLDAGDWAKVEEVLSAVLDRNDEEEDRS
jgi:hypothetical protein